MSECFYYLDAFYDSPEAASKAQEVICSFLREAHEAYWFWQSCRRKIPTPPIASDDDFWPQFKIKFPRVCQMLEKWSLEKLIDKKDWGNGLAGKLGIISTERDIELLQIKNETASSEKSPIHKIEYSAEVWSSSNWTHFAQWVKDETHALSVSWKNQTFTVWRHAQ